MKLVSIPPVPARDALGGLEALVARHQRSVWRFLRTLGADAALADELTQDAFLLAWKKQIVAQTDAETTAWLLRSARFLWLRRIRQRRRQEERVTAVLLEWWLRHDVADGEDRWLSALRHCRQQLQPRALAALELFYADGRSRAAAAQQLGMTEAGFKTLLQRTRELLRQCIERRLH
ncbi:MAG: hypothetical protein IPK26_21255 [Planctomycetes bacterium]|nr:hypothetical protein [Planctomycetota bacterium]